MLRGRRPVSDEIILDFGVPYSKKLIAGCIFTPVDLRGGSLRLERN